MRTVFTAHRRAEEFDALLEGTARLSPRDEARFAELLETVGRLQSAPPPVPRAEFVGDLRDRLMAAAETELVPVDPATRARLTLAPADPRKVRRDRRVATLLGTAALVGATGSVAVAAQASLPGDSLYPVKRALESAHAGVAIGDEGRGEVLLSSAALRLEEVEQLVGGQDAPEPETRAATATTLTTFAEQADEASRLLLADYSETGREGSVIVLREFTAARMEQLEALSALVPPEASDELLAAADLLIDIDARTREACPDCAGAGITEMPHFLASGGVVSGSTVEAVVPGAAGTGEARKQAGGKGRTPTAGTSVGEPPAPAPPAPTVPGAVPSLPLLPGATAPPGSNPRTSAPQAPRSSPSATTLVDTLRETLVGGSTPTDGTSPSTGLLGGVGELLGGVSSGLLGERTGEAVTGTTGGVGGVLDGLLGGRR